MIQNYLRIAFRNLSKNRLFTLLNISGLSLGLAVALLIGLFVRDELSYDAFHEKADRIFRIHNDTHMGGKDMAVALTSAPMGPTMLREYPAVEAFCRFRQLGFITVKKSNETIEEGSNTYVDSSFFQFFSIPMLEGNAQTALVEPNTMVISEKMAQKYFGASTGIVGRTLRINDHVDRRITGVMQNIPSQSHFHYDFLFSMSTLEEGSGNIWLSNNFLTYVLLRKGASEAQFPVYFEELTQRYLVPQIEQIAGISQAEFTANGDRIVYSLQNIREIHLNSDRMAEHEPNSDLKYIWIFGSIALIVLLLACVNFMNLSTARSAHRAREVGVRKALGSNRLALIGQFLTESFILTFCSFALALLWVYLSLPSFNKFAEKDIHFSVFDPVVLSALSGLVVLTALISGSYPAFFLSAFRPIETLKGKFSTMGRGSSQLRSGLVVFQFCSSVALISAVLVVQQQMQYMQNKKLGWDKEQLVMLRNTWWLQGKTLDFKARLAEIPGIEQVSCVDYFPTPSSRNSTAFNPAGKDASKVSVSCQLWEVDFDYQKTFGMRMKTGRWFDARLASDSTVCVLNESAAKSLGWTDPVGHKISTFGGPDLKETLEYEVIGMMEDFHFESLRDQIEPIAMVIGRGSGTMALRMKPEANVAQTMASVETLFKAYLPSQPFNYRFLDDEFNQQYTAELRIGKILGAFAGFAIFIACLGLFGLATFMAEQRTKEIGIRKVLGASVQNLTQLLAKDFLKLVLIAIVLATPITYYFMQKWLSDFAYRIDIQGWMFAAAAFVAIAIALLTVSFQSVRAALMNPVKSLRSE